MSRHTCTKDDPYVKAKHSKAEHPDAIWYDDVDYGGGCYCACYKCPHCGITFKEELAQ